MAEMEIRDARSADLADLDRLERQSFATDRLSRRSMRRLMNAASASFRVATDHDEVLGYQLTLFRRGSVVARLYSIAVAMRRAGVATSLMADVERAAARRGCRAVRLEVHAGNRPAIGLYDRLGYRRIGIRRQYYADEADALLYEKPLAASGSAPAATAAARVLAAKV